MKFTEERLEQSIISLLNKAGYPHVSGQDINREPHEILIRQDLKSFLSRRYAKVFLGDTQKTASPRAK